MSATAVPETAAKPKPKPKPRLKRSSSPRKSQSTPALSREAIASQTAAFLKSGNKIQKIPTGVSGQQNVAGPKHIVLKKRTH